MQGKVRKGKQKEREETKKKVKTDKVLSTTVLITIQYLLPISPLDVWKKT